MRVFIAFVIVAVALGYVFKSTGSPSATITSL
jgi:archaellin